ncbi:MAG: hypothetical protein ABJV04_06620 [Aliiglaciecola sp.]|uniref:hypothetical protein n=1 Tax=Aliiglaciecola sp. TaxID=1872441 RepID=UPI00329A21B7
MNIQVVLALLTFMLLVVSFLIFMFFYVRLKVHLLGENSVLSLRSGFEYHDQFIGILLGKPENFPIYKSSAEQLAKKYKITFKVSISLFLLCLIQFFLMLNGI